MYYFFLFQVSLMRMRFWNNKIIRKTLMMLRLRTRRKKAHDYFFLEIYYQNLELKLVLEIDFFPFGYLKKIQKIIFLLKSTSMNKCIERECPKRTPEWTPKRSPKRSPKRTNKRTPKRTSKRTQKRPKMDPITYLPTNNTPRNTPKLPTYV